MTKTEALQGDAVQGPTEIPLPADLRGKWIAWDENQGKVLAATDTYAELMQCVEQMGLVNPLMERAPGLHPAVAAAPLMLLEGESPDILKDLRETILPLLARLRR